jgi:predicted nucleic acid-binding protein
MAMFFCYSTVFQAIELFSLARSEKEIRAVEDSLSAMKLLGLNARRARKYGELFASARHMNPLYGLVAGLCLESGLPVLTDRKRDFAGIRGLKVVPARMVRRYGSASEILNAIKR